MSLILIKLQEQETELVQVEQVEKPRLIIRQIQTRRYQLQKLIGLLMEK